MAKRKENHAWVKVNTENMTATFDGPTLACAIELFLMLPAEKQDAALQKLTAEMGRRKQLRADRAQVAALCGVPA